MLNRKSLVAATVAALILATPLAESHGAPACPTRLHFAVCATSTPEQPTVALPTTTAPTTSQLPVPELLKVAPVTTAPTTTEPTTTEPTTTEPPTTEPTSALEKAPEAAPAAQPTTTSTATATTAAPPTTTPPTTTTAPTTQATTTTTTTTTTAATTTPATTTPAALLAAAADLVSISSGPATPRGGDTGTTRRFSFAVNIADLRLVGPGWTVTTTVSAFVGSNTGTVLPATSAYSSNGSGCSHSVGKVSVNTVPTVVHTATAPCSTHWNVHFDVDIPATGLVADSYFAVVEHIITLNAA